MKREVQVNSSGITLNVFIQDSASVLGVGKTGLTFNTAGLVCYYVRPREAAVAVPLITQTVTGAHAGGGFVEISAANLPGWYRFDIPDTSIATAKATVGFMIHGASGIAPCPLEIQLRDTSAITEAQQFADVLLMRNMAMVESGGANGALPYRHVLQALRQLRNKWTISGGTLTVFKEDDTTSSYTAATATTAGNPLTSIDPA